MQATDIQKGQKAVNSVGRRRRISAKHCTPDGWIRSVVHKRTDQIDRQKSSAPRKQRQTAKTYKVAAQKRGGFFTAENASNSVCY